MKEPQSLTKPVFLNLSVSVCPVGKRRQPSPPSSYLFTLDVALELGDLDLHGIQLLVWHKRDVWHRLGVIHHLEAEI